MVTQTKVQYTPPMCEELDVRLEGVIAASGDPQDYDNPFGGSEY